MPGILGKGAYTRNALGSLVVSERGSVGVSGIAFVLSRGTYSLLLIHVYGLDLTEEQRIMFDCRL